MIKYNIEIPNVPKEERFKLDEGRSEYKQLFEKFRIFGYVVRTTKSLDEKLKHKPISEQELKMYYYLLGIRSTSFCGLVRYKLKTNII